LAGRAGGAGSVRGGGCAAGIRVSLVRRVRRIVRLQGRTRILTGDRPDFRLARQLS